MGALGPSVTVHRMSICCISEIQSKNASCREGKELLDMGYCRYFLVSVEEVPLIPICIETDANFKRSL
jgi:hypothetical protein